MPLLQRAVVGALSGLFFLLGAVASQAASDTGVYVEFRESDRQGAPVVDRWRLYGASHALVIGIDNYTGGWPRLSNAIKDAKLVAEGLQDQGFEVELLTDVTGAQLREALRRFFAFKGKDPEARLFVWFAGHGHTENGESYLVPADAPLPGSAEFNYVALHMGDLGSLVRIAQSKHVMAVFDSCFAGTIFSSQRSRPPAAITAAVKRPVRQFLTSGDADQKVSDDGTFRTLFLRALKGEETADANRDGYLTGTELSFYLENRVINLTQGSQTPRGGKLRDPKFDQGDFVFVLAPPGGAEAATARSLQDRRGEQDTLFWSSIKDSQDSADFEAYLTQFPLGTFASLARNRLKALRGAEIAALTPPEAPEVAVEEMDATFIAAKAANIRAQPSAQSEKVGRLAVDAAVNVTGKVEGKQWYRVAHAGGTAYVFAPLLKVLDAAEEPGTLGNVTGLPSKTTLAHDADSTVEPAIPSLDSGQEPIEAGAAGAQTAAVNPQRISREEAARRLTEAIHIDYDRTRRNFYRFVKDHSMQDVDTRRVTELKVTRVEEVREDGWVAKFEYVVLGRRSQWERHRGRFLVRTTEDGVEFVETH